MFKYNTFKNCEIIHSQTIQWYLVTWSVLESKSTENSSKCHSSRMLNIWKHSGGVTNRRDVNNQKWYYAVDVASTINNR